MKFNTPYGPAEGNLEGMKIKISQGGGTGYDNYFVPEVPTHLLGREIEMNLRSFIKEIQEATQKLIEAKEKLELQMITAILTQLLKRKPVEEDFKKIQRVFGPKKIGENDKYTLVYQTITLGVVEFFQIPDTRYQIVFYPDKELK